MPSNRSDIIFLFDVLVAIFTIKKYSHDVHSVDDLIDNEPFYFIAKANLEIIGEAINHLLKRSELSQYLPDYWRNVVDYRNISVHDYFGIDYEIMLNIVNKKLPELEQEVIEVIRHIKQLCIASEQDFADVIFDLNKTRKNDIILYLNNLSLI